GEDEVRIVAEHNGYEKLPQKVTHRRTIRHLRKEMMWVVEDELYGYGIHSAEWNWHFPGGLECPLEHAGDDLSFKFSTAKIEVNITGAKTNSFNTYKNNISKSYGVKQESESLNIVSEFSQKCHLVMTVRPAELLNQTN
ncbi:MAG: hypothetical protein D4R45_07415, partial [Planctomycetaceae bacterium]